MGKAVTLLRESLAPRSAGHSDRAASCRNLAPVLYACYEFTGSTALLDEIINLQREALALRQAGHPSPATLCNNLLTALRRRCKSTGSTFLLGEAITLVREALSLRSAGHLNRAISCNNLATALHKHYRLTGATTSLDEAIVLLRESLTLRPAGHLDRALLCNDLADALLDRYRVAGSASLILLDEIVMLHREALSLRPAGHVDRANSCDNLADTLWQDSKATGDIAVIDEVLAHARVSAVSSLPSDVWRVYLLLCEIHLHQDSPHFSIPTATEYLFQASALLPNNTTDFMRAVQGCLDSIWSKHSAWTADTTTMLLRVYANVVTKLPRMTGFVIGTRSQLTALKSVHSFGADTCIAALLSSRPHQAVELIDHAHGVIWAQALHQRDPQLQDLPARIASELETLLRAVSTPVATDALTCSEPVTSYLPREDVRHQQNSRIQAILTEVRAMPGLERFMLGRPYSQLRETASEHPVVILVSARGHIYALIIPNAVQEHPDVLRLNITSDYLARLHYTAKQAGLRTRNAMPDIELGADRQMRPGRFKDTALGVLAGMWQEIVKPVIDHLRLPVRIWHTHLTDLTLTFAH
jgi:hypothetical protein